MSKLPDDLGLDATARPGYEVTQESRFDDPEAKPLVAKPNPCRDLPGTEDHIPRAARLRTMRAPLGDGGRDYTSKRERERQAEQARATAGGRCAVCKEWRAIDRCVTCASNARLAAEAAKPTCTSDCRCVTCSLHSRNGWARKP